MDISKTTKNVKEEKMENSSCSNSFAKVQGIEWITISVIKLLLWEWNLRGEININVYQCMRLVPFFAIENFQRCFLSRAYP